VTASISGLGSGLDINSIVDQLMQIERQSQTRVVAKRDAVQTRLDALAKIRQQFTSVNTAAGALDTAAKWNAFTTTTSDEDVATASATANATTGSLTFTVNSLATTAAMRSTNTIASTGTVIATGNLFVAKGAHALGFSTLTSDASLPVDKHEIRVTQSSAGATRTAAGALAASTIITAGVNDTVTVDVNGTPQTFTIAAGTYTRTQLATALEAATGGALDVGVGATTNRLTLTTTREGSAASLQVTGGTALTDLGLAVDPSAATGVDGVVKVGDTSTTLTSITAGGSATLAAATGNVDVTFSGGVRVGAITGRNVSLGSGTLSAVVNAINQANVGVNAAAVKVGTDAYRLQISSATAGSAGKLNLDTSVFSGIGGLTTMSAGTDAEMTIGEGAGAYTVTSSSNNVTSLLPGVTVNLKQASATAVTVSIARDPGALADKVNALVSAANTAIGEIRKQSNYDAATKKSGPLAGSAGVRSLATSVMQAIANAVGGNDLGAGNAAGISINRDGTVGFTRSKFLEAYEANPDTVADLFVRRGTTTNAAVTFNNATTRTKPGTYAVQITTAATRAGVTGTALGGGTITNAETIDVKIGTTTAPYAAAAGETLTSIAAGLNAAIAASGLALSASVSSNQLVIQSTKYGAAGSFSVRSSDTAGGQTGVAGVAATWEDQAGVDVAGTIGGVAATGSGNILSTATTDATLPGLSIASEATSPGSYGTITYAPGIAARLARVVLAANDSATGSITAAEEGTRSTIRRYDKDIDEWDRRLADRQLRLKLQYASLDTTLGQLRSQSSWLAAQVSSLG
jgi:flagellar hook-associated protein 2